MLNCFQKFVEQVQTFEIIQTQGVVRPAVVGCEACHGACARPGTLNAFRSILMSRAQIAEAVLQNTIYYSFQKFSIIRLFPQIQFLKEYLHCLKTFRD